MTGQYGWSVLMRVEQHFCWIVAGTGARKAPHIYCGLDGANTLC